MTLRGCYCKAGEQAPKPCYDTTQKQLMEREELYNHAPPSGAKIPSHIQRPPMNDDHPVDQ